MNVLPMEKQVQILNALVERCSVRSTARLVGVEHRCGKAERSKRLLLMKDLESRLASRVQLTTDGFRPYAAAVDATFGTNIDFAMLVKVYSGDEFTREWYSPSEIIEARPIPITRAPRAQRISASRVERQNLTVRMQLRRFKRLTNAFSTKLANMKLALALHFAHYNFCCIHSKLNVTPAMASGLTDKVWDLRELAAQKRRWPPGLRSSHQSTDAISGAVQGQLYMSIGACQP
jgi:IS1 family transposase